MAEARFDMRLTDEQVLAYIQASDNRALSFLEIARALRCSPMTVRRSVKRLRTAGRLEWETPAGRVFRFRVTEEPGS